MIKLTDDWETVHSKLISLLELAKSIETPRRPTIEEYELSNHEYERWRRNVIEHLELFLENDTRYAKDFEHGRQQPFQIGNNEPSTPQKLKLFESNIRQDKMNLKMTINLLSVSDAIIKPDEIDLEIRKKYSSKQILELVMEKLYDLYDDFMYPIIPILEGNGIQLNRRHEEFEYVNTLKELGYVETRGIAKYADAQLTLSGKLYIEEKYRSKTPDYSNITNEQSELNEKLDQIFDQAQKANIGNEILFEELQELKFINSKLDKKNFGQLLKGKLFDLTLAKVIPSDFANKILQEIVNSPMFLNS